MHLHTVAQLLSLAALIGATIEYAEIVKRRRVRRLTASKRIEVEQAGVAGLVRVFLADNTTNSWRQQAAAVAGNTPDHRGP